MAFIQPCFIRKNTTELRKKLEELGYKYSTVGGIKSNNIIVSLGCIFDIYPIDTIKRGFNNCIDCGINEELFLALAALRDDTNENQWFIAQDTMWDENYNGEITVYYEENEWLMWGYYSLIEEMPSDFRKATVEEIIAHFNNQ